MQVAAIVHRPMSEYAFPLDEGHFVFRLRTAKKDLKKVTFYYADRADMASELTFFPVDMPRIRTDLLYDWYEVTLKSAWERIAYYFLLDDGKEQCRFAGECFEKMNVHIERSEYFQYPFNHRADLAAVPDWVHEAVVYNIFPDSFADGKRQISRQGKQGSYLGFPSVSTYGGTLRGITDNLDYIRDMGFNCLYLNPIFAAGAYHKYDVMDYFHIDPCFGTDDNFRDLVRAAHEKGIRVIVDGVFNHVSWHHYSFQDVLKSGKESPYYDWFYDLPSPLTLPGEGEAPAYTCFAYVANMPKTNTACPSLREYFCEVGRHWIREYDVDGWRLDVANEVDDGFLRAFRQAVKQEKKDAVIIGEIWENAAHYMTGDMVDGAMNYDFRRFCTQYFAENILTAEEFDLRLSQLLMRYKQQMLPSQLNLLDGHDTCRFLTLCEGNLDKMELAILFQMTFIGMPCVFYGDEKGMDGLTEPEYRKPMPWDAASPLTPIYRQLIGLRKSHPALMRGSFETIEARGMLLHFARTWENERIDIAVNPGNVPVSLAVSGEILLQKGSACGLLEPSGYVITRSVLHGKHNL
ncbi:MAG: glycoside hydrolase family 13 protein [Clostridia bacterium]|nr:glycoside hydrolase family 13 protein [Clostridia bacterium]